MPGIYRVWCDSCDFGHRASASITLVRLADGREEICGHPGERRIAEETTGEPWRELVSQGRILYRYSAVCASCGELDYYGVASGRRRGHIWSIVRQPSRADIEAACSSCGEMGLWPVGDRHLKGLPCPRCGRGRLASELVARS